MSVKIKRIRPAAVLPERATPGSAGADLRACIDSPLTVEPHTCVQIPTGLVLELPGPGYVAYVYARSGIARKAGIAPVNCVGVIDSDYRGEIIVGLLNQFETPYTVQPGERIAQLVISPVLCPDFVETDDVSDTQRGAGGFGSTGSM